MRTDIFDATTWGVRLSTNKMRIEHINYNQELLQLFLTIKIIFCRMSNYVHNNIHIWNIAAEIYMVNLNLIIIL